jgi:ankyrin repeat protein
MSLNKAVVMLLLEKGAQLETKSNNGQTPRLWAAQYRYIYLNARVASFRTWDQ